VVHGNCGFSTLLELAKLYSWKEVLNFFERGRDKTAERKCPYCVFVFGFIFRMGGGGFKMEEDLILRNVVDLINSKLTMDIGQSK
jgi:hypothetical protein